MDDIQEKVLNELKKGKSIKEAAAIINTIPLIVDRWIRLGKKGEEDYIEFYEEYRKIILKETNENGNNTSSEQNTDEQLIKRIIKLLEIDVNYEDIPNILDVSKSKMSNFFNQGKLGISPYDKLYNYVEQAKKRKKIHSLKDNKTKIKKTSEKIESLNRNNKKCVVCGKELSKYTSKNKCKTCSRSIYVANILKDLLKFINPEIPFFKEDLRKLNYNDVEIKGILWTLIDFDLIEKEKNNKYSLKNKKVLDDFLEKWENYIDKTSEDIADNRGKLVKTCKVCKKELSTSKFNQSEKNDDGLKDYCKDCAKQVDAAKSLKIILNYVNAEEQFFKEDLYQYYPETFLLEASIFSLQENDLIDYDFDEMTYSLKNETKLNEFLDKYLVEELVIPEIPIAQKPKTIKSPIQTELESKELTLEEKIDIVLKALKEGKSRKEAFKLIDENSSLLITWKLLGKKGTEPYDYFYKEYSKIKSISKIKPTISITDEESKELDKFKSNQSKRDLFIQEIRRGKSIKEASKIARLNEKLVNRWIAFGKNNKEYYTEFANQYKEARELILQKEEERKNKAKKQTIEYIKQGCSLEEAANKIQTFHSSTVIGWYNSGKRGTKAYKQFFEDCENAKIENVEVYSKYKFTTNYILNLKLNIFIDEIKKGKTIKEACKKARLNEREVNKFIAYGKKGMKPYDKFAEEYKRIRLISQEKDGEKRIIAKNKVVKYIKQGCDLETAASKVKEFSVGTIVGWYNSGKKGEKSHIQFFEDCNNANENFKIKKSNMKFVNDIPLNNKLNLFLDGIIEGKTRKEALKSARLEKKIFDKFYFDGKKGISPYTKFLYAYENSRKIAEKKKEERKNKAKKQTIEYIKQGYDLETATSKVKVNGINKNTIFYWYKSGEKGSDLYKQFYKDCENAKKQRIPKKTVQTKIEDQVNSKNRYKNEDILTNDLKLTIEEDDNETLWQILIEGETDYQHFISIITNIENYKNKIHKISTETINENKLEILIKINIDKKEVESIRKLVEISEDIKSKIYKK